MPPRRRALLAHWSSPTTSTASANASVAVPHVTLAAAALVVVLVADKFVDAACSLNESPPPALCRRRPCCSPRRSRCRRCCRHHHLLLSRFLLLMCSCLLRCVQLMALPRWLVGRFRPLCTNVLAATRRASCCGGPASGFFASGTILFEFIVDTRCDRERFGTCALRAAALVLCVCRLLLLTPCSDSGCARVHHDFLRVLCRSFRGG